MLPISGADGRHNCAKHVKIHKRFCRHSSVFVAILLQILLSTTGMKNATAQEVLHRINCGSTNEAIVPPNNVVWSPDQYSAAGLSYNNCGSTTTSIYCTSRYFLTTDSAPRRYELPVTVSNRTYEVRLHFAEQVRFVFVLCIAISTLYSYLSFI